MNASGNSGQSWEEEGQPRCPEGGHQPVKGSSISDELSLQAFLRKSQQYKGAASLLHAGRTVMGIVWWRSSRCRSEMLDFQRGIESTFLHLGFHLVFSYTHISLGAIWPMSPSAYGHIITGVTAQLGEGHTPASYPCRPCRDQQPSLPEDAERNCSSVSIRLFLPDTQTSLT